MTHSMRVLPAILFLCFAVPAAPAQDASHACAEVVEAEKRLACYDRAFPPVVGAEPVNSGADIEAKRRQAQREFGLSKRQLFERKPEAEQEIEPSRIQGLVKSVAEHANGERVVTLHNDQAWLLTDAASRGRLRAGDAVTIRNAALGTYMLVTPDGIALRARRLR